MAQYYRPRPATTSSAASDIHTEVLSSCDGRHRYGSDIHFENALASSSILVFPSPPSEPETSRSEGRFEFNGSTPSLPTDMSLGSLRSRSGSRRGENPNDNQRSWQHISGTVNRNCDEFPLEESNWELDAEDLRVRWEHVRHTNHPPRRGGGHTRTSSNLSFLTTGLASLTPQPPFRLPFLSFLQSFFSLDESTLHLLSRSSDPQVSILFPSSPGSTFPSHEEREEGPVHGVHQLLLHNPDKPQNRALLKAAMDPSETPASANPLLASPMRIPVWRFLDLVMEGGAKAWREVRTWEIREARPLGV